MKQGYSLIELTIVVGLVALLGIGISSAVLMSLVTISRTRSLTHVRESGDYAVNQIKQLIRNAKVIESCNGTSQEIILTGYDGGTTTIAAELVADNTRIASNSGTYLTPADIKVNNFTVTCLPDETNPQLIKVKFGTELSSTTVPDRENPALNFETSIELRND